MKTLSIALIITLILATAFAGQHPQIITYPGTQTPFMTGNTDYNEQENFPLVGGYDEIIYAKATIIMDALPVGGTIITLTVNNQPCQPPSYESPPERRYTIIFDCTDIITEPGTYNTTINTTKNALNLYTEWEITYADIPCGDMGLYGTEYWQGENGTVFLKLEDANHLPVNDAHCHLTIWNPNKTIWYMAYPLTYLNQSNGLYYADLFIQSQPGIYMLDAYCFYPDVQYTVIEPYLIEFDGTLDGGTNDTTNVRYTDCNFLKTKVGYYQNFTFNESGIGNLNLSAVTEFVFVWTGQREKEGFYRVWNFTNSSWITMGDLCPFKIGPGICEMTAAITRSLTYGFTDIVNGDVVKVQVYTPDDNKKIWTDEATIVFHNNGSAVGDIRGGGEIHVHDANITTAAANLSTLTNLTAAEVWNHTDRNLTSYPNFSTLTATQVWSHTPRTLTDYNQTSIINKLDQIISLIGNLANITAADVWTFGTRTLTGFGTLVADIWSYTPRTVNATCNATINATANCTVNVEGKCPVIIKSRTCS